MSKITTYKLPRKLKVSFSSSPKDAANATINDLDKIIDTVKDMDDI